MQVSPVGAHGWVREAGAWAPALYLGVCLLAGVLMIPGSATKLAAGALFGLAEGMVWGFAGAVLGSVAAFAVARLGGRSWLRERIERQPRLRAFDRSVGDDGRRIALLVRLSPLIPFNVLNYALGFSRVRTRDYLLASFGMLLRDSSYRGDVSFDEVLNWALAGKGEDPHGYRQGFLKLVIQAQSLELPFLRQHH